MSEKKNRNWLIGTISCVVAVLVVFALPTIIIDPLFHYHGPLEGFAYDIHDERYQNDGIVRHFDYDAIITGSSMTENFKTSEMDALFGTNAIKVPFSGAGYKELSRNLQRAFEANPGIDVVLWGIDIGGLSQDKDWMRYDSYPDYLYDNNIFNDVEYVLNKEILLNRAYGDVWQFTSRGNSTTTFDEYANWMEGRQFGAEAIAEVWQRSTDANEVIAFSQADRQNVEVTLRQNIMPLIEENPQTTFYLFFPPYSICYWDDENAAGMVEFQLRAMEYAVELLLAYDNVRMFEFFRNHDLICNLNNYKDHTHYSGAINSQMLEWMANGEYPLTEENYQERFSALREFYLNFDYDEYFAKLGCFQGR